jgi:hypothetical protein
VRAVDAHALLHLGGQFACRGQDQHARWAASVRRAFGAALLEALQQRQHESGGLAGAGLRGSEQIATGQDWWDGLLLDGCGLGVALRFDSAEQLGQQAEIGKTGIDDDLLNRPAAGIGPAEPVQADAMLKKGTSGSSRTTTNRLAP